MVVLALALASLAYLHVGKIHSKWSSIICTMGVLIFLEEVHIFHQIIENFVPGGPFLSFVFQGEQI